MKTLIKSLPALVIATAFFALPAFASTSEWSFDTSHSNIGFTVKHMMVTNVHGKFQKFDGKFLFDEKDVRKSSVEVKIEAASIFTADEKRDAHLRAPDFFDVEKFPAITFKSTAVEKAGKDRLKVTGDLTMKGVTKKVVLDVEGPTAEMKDPWGNIKRGVSATTKLNRKDFGVTWNKTLDGGGLVVGEEVKIQIDLQVVKKK